METEQAHSSRIYPLGRDAALRRPRTADNDVALRHSRTAQRAVPTSERTPVIWLNLVCLDAPLVSVAWLWLFAQTFHRSVDPSNCAALFLTAWSIYLADRLADSQSLPANGPRSLRHEFCLRYRRVWIGGLMVIVATDAVIIWRNIGMETLIPGAIIGTLVLVHLVLNYSLGGAWPPLPLKEFTTGFLFAAGTLVALFPVFRPITDPMVFTMLAFACLCTLNCLSIAHWERELDEAQGKVSFATRFPGPTHHLGKLSLALALGCGVMTIICREAAPIFECVGVSSFFLALLDSFRGRIARDQRTALADLVLLTPLLALFVMNA